jgi:hypothetical protein
MHLNSDRLASTGFWVPDNFVRFGGHNYRKLARQGATFSGNLAALFHAAERSDNEAIRKILRYLFQTDLPHVLLSSELVFYYGNLIKQVIDAARAAGFSTEVLAYLPRQDRAIVSSYLQNVRNHGFGGTIPDFLKSTAGLRYFRYWNVLHGIVQHSAPERMVVRTFHRAFLRNGDVLADFLAVVDPAIDFSGWDQPPPDTNSSLHLECYEILRGLHQMQRGRDAHRLARQQVIISEADRQRIFGYYYTHEVRVATIRDYYPDNQRLVEMFLADRSQEEKKFWSDAEAPGMPVQLDSTRMAGSLSFLLNLG